MIHGIIFDVGSTLLSFDGDRQQALLQAGTQMVDFLRSEGVPLDPVSFRTAFLERILEESERREVDHRERPAYLLLKEQLEIHGLSDVSISIIKLGLEVFYTVIEGYWKPLPGLYEVLSELQHEGYRIGMVSNATDAPHVRRLVEKAGIRSFFDPLVVSADIGFRKPSPEPFQIVLDAWQASPSEIVMIGDSLEHDVLGANTMGMRSIWFQGGRSTIGEEGIGGELRPDRIAEELSELPSLLREMSGKQRIT